MLPGMNMNQIKKLMKDVKEIPAERVIIEGETRLVIENPKVMKMDVMGQTTFQIVGDAKEEAAEPEITDQDVKMVMEQTSASEGKVKEALIKNSGDIAKTILELKE